MPPNPSSPPPVRLRPDSAGRGGPMLFCRMPFLALVERGCGARSAHPHGFSLILYNPVASARCTPPFIGQPHAAIEYDAPAAPPACPSPQPWHSLFNWKAKLSRTPARGMRRTWSCMRGPAGEWRRCAWPRRCLYIPQFAAAGKLPNNITPPRFQQRIGDLARRPQALQALGQPIKLRRLGLQRASC